MPIMRPEIQAILRQVGLEKNTEAPGSLTEKLDAAGLGLDDTLNNLSVIVNGTGNDSLKLQALRDVLKLHGALKENAAPQIPSFQIIINDPSNVHAATTETPAINPIFMPRQLLTKIEESKAN